MYDNYCCTEHALLTSGEKLLLKPETTSRVVTVTFADKSNAIEKLTNVLVFD